MKALILVMFMSIGCICYGQNESTQVPSSGAWIQITGYKFDWRKKDSQVKGLGQVTLDLANGSRAQIKIKRADEFIFLHTLLTSEKDLEYLENSNGFKNIQMAGPRNPGTNP